MQTLSRNEAVEEYGLSYVQVNSKDKKPNDIKPNHFDWIQTEQIPNTPVFVETLGLEYVGKFRGLVSSKENTVPTRVSQERLASIQESFKQTNSDIKVIPLPKSINLPDNMFDIGQHFIGITDSQKIMEDLPLNTLKIAHIFYKPVHADTKNKTEFDVQPLYWPSLIDADPHEDDLMTVRKNDNGTFTGLDINADKIFFERICTNDSDINGFTELMKAQFVLASHEALNQQLSTLDAGMNKALENLKAASSIPTERQIA